MRRHRTVSGPRFFLQEVRAAFPASRDGTAYAGASFGAAWPGQAPALHPILGHYSPHRNKRNQKAETRDRRFLSTPALFVEKSSQFQEAENHQAKPEIYQGSEVKLVSVMPGGFRQVGIEGEIQAIAKDNGKQVFEPFHRYGFHLRYPA